MKHLLSKELLIISLSCLLFIFLFNILMPGQMVLFAKQPKIISLDPQDDKTIQTETMAIKGEVRPQKSIIEINGKTVEQNKGVFSYVVELSEGINIFNIVVSNKDKTISKSLTITRIFTPEEIAKIEKEKKEAEALIKVEEEIEAKELAKWEKTKAGQICKKHPEWEKADCEDVADKRIWIGMDIWMVVEERGNPNDVNTSNYGDGEERQYCWFRYNPSCFYDNNGDGKVDIYN